jgi:PleD family two-component response regulator
VDRNRVLQISTSVGVAFHRPGMTADELLREADQAMYRVKASGRDGLHVAQG